MCGPLPSRAYFVLLTETAAVTNHPPPTPHHLPDPTPDRRSCLPLLPHLAPMAQGTEATPDFLGFLLPQSLFTVWRVSVSSLHGPMLFSDNLWFTMSPVPRLPNPPPLSTICCPQRLRTISGPRFKVLPLLSPKLCEARHWVSRRALGPHTAPAYLRHSINTPKQMSTGLGRREVYHQWAEK